MYCPKCGTQNINEANFCRLCGMAFQVISPPPQALLELPNYGRAFRPLFIGSAFLLLALISIFFRAGFFWWMLFPAISLVSRGVRRLNQIKQAHLYNAPSQPPGTLYSNSQQPIPPASYSEVRVRPTGELIPPSVTENTTRLFDAR
jgi:hypothetical protein